MILRAKTETSGGSPLAAGRSQLLYGGMGRLTESSIVNTHNRSHAITAEIVVPDDGAEGVIIAMGGLTGGFTLYVKNGKPKYCYSFFGLNLFFVEGDSVVPSGKHQLRVEFAYDGGGVAKGGNVTLYVDGRKTGAGRVERTEPALFSADETCDIGTKHGSAVTTDYSTRTFTGKVNWVEIAVDSASADADHFPASERRRRLVMTQ